MASNEATNAADPAAETNAVPKNQGMTDWGEPLTVTIPPPFADVVRNILGNKLVSKHMKRATSKQKWKNHRQSKRQSKKHNKFKNKQKTLKAAKVKPIQLKLSEKSAADAEIAALQKSTEEIEEQERKSPVDDMANMMEVLPDFLKERVLVALDTGEKPPHWVIKLMRKMGVDFDVLREVVLEKAEKDQTQVLEDIKSEEEEAEEESESGSESESEDEEGKRRVRGGVGRGRGGFRGRGRGGRGRGRGVNGNCAKGQGKGKFVGRGRGRGRRGGGRGGKFSNRDKKPEDFFGNMLKDGMEMLMEKMQQFGIDAEFEAKFTEKHLEKKEEEEEGQEPKQELSKEDKKALRRSKRESKRKERKEKKEKREKKEEVKQVNQEKTNPNPEGLSQEELVKLFSQLKRDKKNKSDSQ